jgi:hypothetical protein
LILGSSLALLSIAHPGRSETELRHPTEIKTGCTHLGVENWLQEIVTGPIIVAAVALGRLRHRRLAG